MSEAQMEEAMIHRFKIILETIYNPVLQMLDPRPKKKKKILTVLCWVSFSKSDLNC